MGWAGSMHHRLGHGGAWDGHAPAAQHSTTWRRGVRVRVKQNATSTMLLLSDVHMP
jgi:hypothetical protein